MFESFIIFIQAFLVLSSTLCLHKLIQPKQQAKRTTIAALLLSLLLILIIRIPNFFNKADFIKGLSLALILLICIFYLSLLIRNKSSRIKKISLIGILALTIVQAVLKLYDTILGISAHGHTLTEKSSLLKMAGYLLGAFFILLWVIGLKRAVSTMREKEKNCFFILMLAVFLFQQLGSGMLWLYQKTIALDWIPHIFQLISLLVNQELWTLYALLALILVFCLGLNRKQNTPLHENTFTAADKRKAIASARKNRRIISFLVVMMLVALASTTILKSTVTREETLSEPEAYETKDDDIIIPLAKISDGNLHRYEYMTKGKTAIRFIVIEKSEGAYGVGLDACEICGASGYIQRGDTIVCKLCDVVMNKATIGFKGGCNPIPLAYNITEQKIVIHKSDLDKQESVFK
ncbi:Fe-S-containing protein [Enterococcus faecalis]